MSSKYTASRLASSHCVLCTVVTFDTRIPDASVTVYDTMEKAATQAANIILERHRLFGDNFTKTFEELKDELLEGNMWEDDIDTLEFYVEITLANVE